MERGREEQRERESPSHKINTVDDSPSVIMNTTKEYERIIASVKSTPAGVYHTPSVGEERRQLMRTERER